jgi:hypothetical protein
MRLIFGGLDLEASGLSAAAVPGARVGMQHGPEGIEKRILFNQAGDGVFFERVPDLVGNIRQSVVLPLFVKSLNSCGVRRRISNP